MVDYIYIFTINLSVIDKELIFSEPKEGSIQERGLSMSLGEGGISLNLANEDWYVYSEEYGTDEEKYLVKFIYNIKDKLLKIFKEVYLIISRQIMVW